MIDTEFKNDLFDDAQVKNAVKKTRLLDKYTESRVFSHLTIPVEHVFIAAVSVLILLILAYAIGVERGKHISAREISGKAASGEEALEDMQAGASKDAVAPSESINNFSADILREIEKRANAASEENVPASVDKGPTVPVEETSGAWEEVIVERREEYAVQLASFKDREAGDREMEKLRKQGVDARIVRKGEWFQLCAEGYPDISEAKEAIKKFKLVYKDCYIRKVR
ncbi:MAG: SPOR domain-containing protein [Candidatus Omnitrophica bacterium]|nr:SPOR domain-containing protein [Candidatus Omnitrophota bacterium]MDD5488815.1 SPOR domain-containing protein [Candidatus Omnitrophota bacterium]